MEKRWTRPSLGVQSQNPGQQGLACLHTEYDARAPRAPGLRACESAFRARPGAEGAFHRQEPAGATTLTSALDRDSSQCSYIFSPRPTTSNVENGQSGREPDGQSLSPPFVGPRERGDPSACRPIERARRSILDHILEPPRSDSVVSNHPVVRQG